MINKILPNTKTKLRILKIIYNNPEINFSELVGKAETSPNIVLKYVNELVKTGVLKDKRIGGKKKTHIRLFQPNYSEIGKDLFSFVELNEMEEFMEKYAKLRPILIQLKDLLSGTKTEFCLIYGSFARFSPDKDSDLDLWLVGNIDAKTKNRLRDIFSTLDREYTMTIENKRTFIKNINSPIHQNILREHIIIHGEKKFIDILRAVNK